MDYSHDEVLEGYSEEAVTCAIFAYVMDLMLPEEGAPSADLAVGHVIGVFLTQRLGPPYHCSVEAEKDVKFDSSVLKEAGKQWVHGDRSVERVKDARFVRFRVTVTRSTVWPMRSASATLRLAIDPAATHVGQFGPIVQSVLAILPDLKGVLDELEEGAADYDAGVIAYLACCMQRYYASREGSN